MGKHFDELVEIMKKLRGREGCPWDKEQTIESIKPYLLEECYEVIEAIESGCSEKIKDELPNILYNLENPDTLAVEIGIPLYFGTRAASSEGFQEIFSGQGADELFAGYSRYERVLKLDGYQKLHNALFDDVLNLWSHDLDRDFKITTANDIELMLPYLTLDFVRYSLIIPPEFKLKKVNGHYSRKYVLYTLGGHLGLDEEILNIPKTAAQYGSGASKGLRRIRIEVICR